jgi:hypothetical protein
MIVTIARAKRELGLKKMRNLLPRVYRAVTGFRGLEQTQEKIHAE